MQNKYEILAVIGEGSYGIVYKCRNRETNETVAIKKFKDNTEISANKSMLRELKSLKIFNHKNIINFRESFKKKGNYFFVFDYIEKNLLEFLTDFPEGIEPNLIKHIMFQICNGMREIHKLNFAHRDIKPENVLIDRTHKLKICDFGFTRLIEKSPSEYLTEYVATRWYRAPELLIGDKNYGLEIDCWSLGCIMGELIDGNPIFPGENDMEQMYMIYKICGKDSFSYDQIQIIEKKQSIAHKLEKTKYINPLNNSEISIDISIDKRYAGKISRDALNFLKRLLDPNPETRIKTDEIFDHPYLLNYCDIYVANNELYINNFDNNNMLIKSPNNNNKGNNLNLTMLNNNYPKKNKSNFENNQKSQMNPNTTKNGNFQQNNTGQNNVPQTNNKKPEKNLKINITNNNFYNNGLKANDFMNQENNTNSNLSNSNLNNLNGTGYTNLNSLNKGKNNIPILENIPFEKNIVEDQKKNKNDPAPNQKNLEEQNSNDTQIYKESMKKLYSETPKNVANQLFNKKNIMLNIEKKIEEDVSEENFNIVDENKKDPDDFKYNEIQHIEAIKPVEKQEKNNYNYYNNIKLYKDELLEQTVKIKKTINPYESIYKINLLKETEKNKEKDKKSKKDKSNKNINNYSSSISHISKDKENNINQQISGQQINNNVPQTRSNKFMLNDLLAISENAQNQNKTKGQNFLSNFDKAKVFLSPQKLQETSPMFFNQGDMKSNNYSNSVVNDKDKKINNNDKLMLNEFKNFAFGTKANNFNKPQIDSLNNFNSPENQTNNYAGNVTHKGFINNIISISNNMNNTNFGSNNYSSILNNQGQNAQNLNNQLVNSNIKISKKHKKNNDQSHVSKSVNFNPHKISNGYTINNGNKENQGQITDFLKSIVYQSNKNNNDHKRNASYNTQGLILNSGNIGEDNKKTSNLKKLQLPLIVKKEVGNKL